MFKIYLAPGQSDTSMQWQLLEYCKHHELCMSEVRVYDFLYRSLSEETPNAIFLNSVKYFLPPVQHQKGNRDCSLFAIVLATYLANGRDSRLISHSHFNQDCFRSHLLTCFELKDISEFPYNA